MHNWCMINTTNVITRMSSNRSTSTNSNCRKGNNAAIAIRYIPAFRKFSILSSWSLLNVNRSYPSYKIANIICSNNICLPAAVRGKIISTPEIRTRLALTQYSRTRFIFKGKWRSDWSTAAVLEENLGVTIQNMIGMRIG